MNQVHPRGTSPSVQRVRPRRQRTIEEHVRTLLVQLATSGTTRTRSARPHGKLLIGTPRVYLTDNETMGRNSWRAPFAARRGASPSTHRGVARA